LIKTLYTIGYTGFTIQEFIGMLSDVGVKSLIDTREIPISRKRGFAKTAIRQHLELSGISYHHFRLLGSPRAQRHEVRETGDYSRFFDEVRKHIATPEATEQLREAIAIAKDGASCLMCCCPDWTRCHRSCLVESISKSDSFEFEHLAKSVIQANVRRSKAA
jgi:uncharacterized protein (DUF488 family)